MSENTNSGSAGQVQTRKLPVSFSKNAWAALMEVCPELIIKAESTGPDGDGRMTAHLKATEIMDIHMKVKDELTDFTKWHNSDTGSLSDTLRDFLHDHEERLADIIDDIEEAGNPFDDDDDDDEED